MQINGALKYINEHNLSVKFLSNGLVAVLHCVLVAWSNQWDSEFKAGALIRFAADMDITT